MTSDMCFEKNLYTMSSIWYLMLLYCALCGITVSQDVIDKGAVRRNGTEESALTLNSLLMETIIPMDSISNCCHSSIYLSIAPTSIITTLLEHSIYSTFELYLPQSTENVSLKSYLLSENSVNTFELSKELISKNDLLSPSVFNASLPSLYSSSFDTSSTIQHTFPANSLEDTDSKIPSAATSETRTVGVTKRLNRNETLLSNIHPPKSNSLTENNTDHETKVSLESSRLECQSNTDECNKSVTLNAMNSKEHTSIDHHEAWIFSDELNSTMHINFNTEDATENDSYIHITSLDKAEFVERTYDTVLDAKSNFRTEKSKDSTHRQNNFPLLHSSENKISKTTVDLLQKQELRTPIIQGSFEVINTPSIILSKSETEELPIINATEDKIYYSSFQIPDTYRIQETMPAASLPLKQLQKIFSSSSVNSQNLVDQDKLIVVTPSYFSNRKSKEVTDQTKHSLIENSTQILGEEYAHVSVVSEETKPSKFSIFHSDSEDYKANHKNKTSRDESPKMDDIISGIIHLLAGEVQMVRPPPHFHLGHSHAPVLRPPRPASTRINNRGPPTLISHSRTVVVFSQPDHHITLVPRPLHHQIPQRLRPTTIRRPHFTGPMPPSHAVGILPTRPEIFKVSTTSVVHLYKPLVNPPAKIDHYGALPFDGDMFIAVAKPIMTESRYVATNAGFQHGNYDAPSNLDELSGEQIVADTKTFNTYEVFQNTLPQSASESDKNIRATMLLEVTNAHNSETQTFKLSSQSSRGETTVIKQSKFESKIPSGPITDWAPVFERPTMKYRPDSKHDQSQSYPPDHDVVIITQPTIFDLTVTNALAGIENPIRNHNNPNHIVSGDSKTEQSSIVENMRPSQDSFDTQNIATNLDSKSILNFQIYSSFTSVNSNDRISTFLYQTPELFESATFKLKQPFDIASTSLPVFLDSSIPSKNYISSRHKGTFSIADMTKQLSSSFVVLQRVPIRPDTANMKFDATSNGINSENVVTVVGKGTVHPEEMYISSTIEQFSTPILRPPGHSNGGTLLGRPIVIPVDIEEVRPYVGAINPPRQGSRPSNVGHHPPMEPYPSNPTGVGNVQVAQAGINVAEDARGKPTSPSRPHSPVQTVRPSLIRTPPRQRPNTPLVRIDTCIVGDDTTCDLSLNETCKMEQGVSSCLCRPGFARSLTRLPCLPVVSVMLSLKVDRMGDEKISFSSRYLNPNTEEYRLMEFEAKQALSSLFSHTAFSRNFLGVTVNKFYSIGGRLIINATVNLEEKESTRAPILRLQMRQEIVRAISSRNQNIGESRLYVEGPLNPVPAIEDLNECADSNLNDCSINGHCQNVFGTFQCKCKLGYTDSHPHDERQRGRQCSACSPDYCSNHGLCFIENGQKVCKCSGNYIGARCEIDSEVLGVALGASLAAIIIIILTLVCLCVWNRRWKREHHKQDVMSARSVNSNQTFSYLNKIATANTYRPTFEDRMRWAQISDVVGNGYMQAESGMSQAQSTSTLGNQSVYAGPSRCQSPNNDELTWYNYNTRPRSRGASQSQSYVNGGFYDMDFSTRETYVGPSYAPSGRHGNSSNMRQYYK